MTYTVYQDGPDWVAKRAGSEHVSIVAESREQAIARASAILARTSGGEITVREADGSERRVSAPAGAEARRTA